MTLSVENRLAAPLAKVRTWLASTAAFQAFVNSIGDAATAANSVHFVVTDSAPRPYALIGFYGGTNYVREELGAGSGAFRPGAPIIITLEDLVSTYDDDPALPMAEKTAGFLDRVGAIVDGLLAAATDPNFVIERLNVSNPRLSARQRNATETEEYFQIDLVLTCNGEVT